MGRTAAAAQAMAEASPYYRGAGLVGTPAQVVAQLRAWTALGVTHFVLRFVDFPQGDGIRRFMDEVMPAFA